MAAQQKESTDGKRKPQQHRQEWEQWIETWRDEYKKGYTVEGKPDVAIKSATDTQWKQRIQLLVVLKEMMNKTQKEMDHLVHIWMTSVVVRMMQLQADPRALCRTPAECTTPLIAMNTICTRPTIPALEKIWCCLRCRYELMGLV